MRACWRSRAIANSRGRSPVSANLPSVLEVLRAATAGAGRVVRYPAGNTLTVEGAPAADVHVILSGAVKLVRTVADSRDVTIGIRSSGWVLGLAPAILGVPHPCRAVTMVSSEMSIMPADSFKELVLRDAGVNQAIAWLLSHEVMSMSTVRRASWTALNLRRRLELQLMEISVLHGQVQDGWSRITLPLTQQELADLAVASRERVSRAMAQLTQAGRIRREGGWLLVRTEEGGAVRP